MHHGLDRLLRVEVADALDPGIGKEREGILADHNRAMSRAGPLGEPIAFQIGVHQALLNLSADLWEEQVVERVRGAEGVPETAVGVEHAVVQLAVVGAVVDRLALGVELVKLLREQQRPIETAIERAALVLGAAFHPGAAQGVVPARFGPLTDGVEIGVANFALQVPQGLLRADVGRGDLAAHDLVFAGVEFHVSPDMRAHQLGLAFLDTFGRLGFRSGAPATAATGWPGPDALGSERAVEYDHEIAREAVVLGHAAARYCG